MVITSSTRRMVRPAIRARWDGGTKKTPCGARRRAAAPSPAWGGPPCRRGGGRSGRRSSTASVPARDSERGRPCRRRRQRLRGTEVTASIGTGDPNPPRHASASHRARTGTRSPPPPHFAASSIVLSGGSWGPSRIRGTRGGETRQSAQGSPWRPRQRPQAGGGHGAWGRQAEQSGFELVPRYSPQARQRPGRTSSRSARTRSATAVFTGADRAGGKRRKPRGTREMRVAFLAGLTTLSGSLAA